MKHLKRTWVLVALLLLPTLLWGQKPFYFIQLTDPQFGMLNKNNSFEQETALMEKAVQAINKLSPRFVVITGDLINLENDARQMAEFKRVCGLISPEIPLYLTPGNHDVGLKPTPESVGRYVDAYGYDRFAFQINGTAFIGINTPVIWGGDSASEEAQFAWLKQALRDAGKSHHRVLFGHHPLYINQATEADRYENFPAVMRKKYLELFQAHQVNYMFAGHLHYNASGKEGNFLMTTTGATGMPLGKDASGLRVVKVYPDRIESDYYSLDALPQEIVL